MWERVLKEERELRKRAEAQSNINIWPQPDPEATRAEGAEAERARIIEKLKGLKRTVEVPLLASDMVYNRAIDDALTEVER
jgi:hypothetical protein